MDITQKQLKSIVKYDKHSGHFNRGEENMNERIRELALLAGYKPLSPPTFADELNEIFMQKFAELIVEECADFVDEWERYQEEMLYRTILGKLPTGASDKLKEHFGYRGVDNEH